VVRRVRGAAIAAAAGAACIACFLPAFQIAIEAFIGAGAEERVFRYERSVTLVPSSGVGGFAVLALGLALVALGVVGAARGWAAASSIAAFILALVLLSLVFDAENGPLDWPGPHGVIGHEESSAGPLLGDSIDDLARDARQSPEAADPGWTPVGGPDAYAARGLAGWRIVLWSTLVLCWLGGYGLLRLRLGPWTSVAVVFMVSVGALVWLVLRALGGD
jgi:hypothetical protein